MKISAVTNFANPQNRSKINKENPTGRTSNAACDKIAFKSANLILSEALPTFKKSYNIHRSYPIGRESIDAILKQKNDILERLKAFGESEFKRLTDSEKGLLKTFEKGSDYDNCVVKVLENEEQEAVEILKQSKKFGIEEYKKLTDSDKELLKKVTRADFFDPSDNYPFMRFRAYRFNTMDIGEKYSKRLDELYPNGYTFVSIGRSPSLLGKYLELEGKDVKYCPISGIGDRYKEGFSDDFVKQYKEYLDGIGFTKEFVRKSNKPIVITDFKDSGSSLYNFEKLLATPSIGIVEGEKVHFRPMNGDSWYSESRKEFALPEDRANWHKEITRKGIFSNAYESNKDYPDYSIKYALRSGMSNYKEYAPVPTFYPHSYLNKQNLNEMMSNYEQNIDCKKMLFSMADRMNESGKLA